MHNEHASRNALITWRTSAQHNRKLREGFADANRNETHGLFQTTPSSMAVCFTHKGKYGVREVYKTLMSLRCSIGCLISHEVSWQ